MTKRERAKQIYDLLDKNSPEKIEFLTADATWKLLICIILSSQTTDKMVMKVAPHLFEKYSSVEALANADVDGIKDCIKSIGFYNAKANNIKHTAEILHTEYNDEVPLSLERLIELPGVGRKTANCIIGHTLGEGAIIVDTHFKRVVNRLGLTKTENPEKIETEIKKLFTPKEQFRFSMTANLFGRDVCHSRNPACGRCTLQSFCKVHSR